MPPTAVQLIRELGRRERDFVPSTATVNPAGKPVPASQNVLYDPTLLKYFTADVPGNLNAWVYGGLQADAGNIGQEARASAWSTAQYALTLYYPGFPAQVTSGQYEIHLRWQRSRILEAINSAVRQLSLTWYRPWIDESLVSLQNTWAYTLPPGQDWTNVQHIEIQVSTDTTQVGYPYQDAEWLNWKIDRQVTQSGIESFTLRFGTMPPPGRIIRIYGETWLPDLVGDTDILAVAGAQAGPATEWVYQAAAFSLNDWTANAAMTGESAKLRQIALDQLQRQKETVLAMAPSHPPARIVTPGRGDGTRFGSREDWRYMGAFRSP